MQRNSFLLLDNPVMEYTWGSRTHIPALLDQKTPSATPMAELWMGAHPKAPSRVGNSTLLEIIDNDPVGMLGATTAKRFSNRLPFLFKLLAAGAPLSLQAHPNRDQARAGFAAENAEGIALDAPNRSYRDDSHKPEVLCALTEFWGLNGFREIPQILRLLEEADLQAIAAETREFRSTPTRSGLRDFFGQLLRLDGNQKRDLTAELCSKASRSMDSDPESHWIQRIGEQYPEDIGALCVLLLNLVKLEPGQAMFANAGDLHAYLDGFGIELMANSDNVLRGGITGKHVDIPELMKVLTFEDRPVEMLDPQDGTYRTPTDEFLLAVIGVDEGTEKRQSPEFEILIAVEGQATISDPDGREAINLQNGASVAIPASVGEYSIEGSATLYSATIPQK